MKTRRIIFSAVVVCAIAIIGCGSTNSTIGLYRILTMNQEEFTAIKNISVEDEKGFKFIKSTLEANKFDATSSTTESQTITEDDKAKIKEILEKY